MYPPLIWVGGWPVQNIPPPPLVEGKITLNLTFSVKKLTFLSGKTIKNSDNRIARSARSHIIILLTLDLFRFCQYMYSYLDISYLKKGVE